MIQLNGRGADESELKPSAQLKTSANEHRVHFYDSDEFLLSEVHEYIGTGLDIGDSCIVVLSPLHRQTLEASLEDGGWDLAAARASGRYQALDAAETLSTFLVDGKPQFDLFCENVGGVIEQAARNGHVRVFGEMVALLAEENKHAAALSLERFWNDLHRKVDFSLLCAYPMHLFGRESLGVSMDEICAEHSSVRPTESYWDGASTEDRQLAVVRLQQKASALEAEVAERKRVEAALREQIRVNETIRQVGLTLAAELDLEKLVQGITDAATELTGAQFGAFFYNGLDERGEAYTLYTLSGAPREAFAAFPMPGKTQIFGPTFEGKGVIRLTDVRQDPRFGRNPPYYGMPPGHLPVVSYLAVPVISRSHEVLGGLFFGHPEPGVFTERAEHLALGLAAQAAVAIDNARLYEDAKRALTVRDEFLSLAAHELKTPITTVRGFAQLALRRLKREESAAPAHVHQALQVIDHQADRLNRLVSQLLDVRRIESGKLLLELSDVDLAMLVESIVQGFQVGAPEREIQLRITSPLEARVDPLRIEQVVTNLLDNAAKYSPEDTPIEVELSRLDAEHVRLVVMDHGPGVPVQDRERVFDRFIRLQPGETAAGMGLGLYVSREIVRLHGGAIEVEDTPGGGCCVAVHLPLKADEID